jgi:sugar phosphate isomerase/epimerase
MQRLSLFAFVLALGSVLTACRTAQSPTDKASVQGGSDAASRIGVQSYSARKQIDADLDGTMAALRDMGFVNIELHNGLIKKIKGDPVEYLHGFGFKLVSTHVDYIRLRDETAAVIAEAKALGVQSMGVPWIPHEGTNYTAADNEAAIDLFNRVAPMVKTAGMRFFYHPHGYEFHDGGTGKALVDDMIERTRESGVEFQMDVFWVVNAGKDPMDYLRRYPGRFTSFHMKDMKQGTPTPRHDGKADVENQVVVGTGIIDYKALVAEAEKQGKPMYIIEDEGSRSMEQMPQSMAYIKSIVP